MTDDEHDDPMIGAELEDRYRVTARLGEGGMGVVYRAEHLIFGTQLALKVLKSAAAQTAEALQRLEREAQAASAIGDPCQRPPRSGSSWPGCRKADLIGALG